MSRQNDYHGKVAIISGSTRGLGLGIAEKLAENGASVVISEEKSLELSREVASDLSSRYGVRCLGLKIDVSDERMVVDGVAEVLKTFGRVDILVNNAGIQHVAPITEFDTASWRLLCSIQLDGAFYMTRECMRVMRETKTGGRIINIGSVHSFIASANKAAYVAVKHALLGLTRAAAKDGASYGVAVNLVAPGYVLTDLVKRQIPERVKAEGITEDQVMRSMTAETLDGKFTEVEEVANAVIFFAGAGTLAYSGQSLIVSHGFVME